MSCSRLNGGIAYAMCFAHGWCLRGHARSRYCPRICGLQSSRICHGRGQQCHIDILLLRVVVGLTLARPRQRLGSLIIPITLVFHAIATCDDHIGQGDRDRATKIQGISHLEQPPSDLPAEAHGCRTQGGAAPWPRTTRLLAHCRMKKERSLRSAAI